MTSSPGLMLSRIALRLNGRMLLAVDHAVAPGTVLTVMGPSGVGKSSLLAFLGGFLAPAFEAEGCVFLNGEDMTTVPAERRRMGLLFQDALLFPHLSVGENLLFGLAEDVSGRQARRRAALAMLERMGLSGLYHRDPATLSGGQQARVALARTLLSEPRALLLDEPFSRLDQERRADMRHLVFGLARERTIPAVLVTHDPEDAAAAGGPIIEIGTDA
ncbi:ATP-binding cassette domain-containing protein [Consotaella salsifontis]|uniref:Putative thiamine transport system ATP-binding protein n=1 Tax=Consotaella salsifontis TaxID=1365950 RepID=A0A1T4T8R9_9HYPH|nr:ATP-binding cassette domain-containing protein [Consotaella salsifontis]SKA36797.1 putative thiamine transport system ATP-binding protein [Consotaella salsifontis]